MAFPFGGHPQLAQYLHWAREQGCTIQSGYASDRKGKTHTVTKIETPGGKKAVVVGVAQTEYLVPTMVGYLDRRLGLNSPWFSLDDG
jgi:hypothetical protein